MIGLLNQMTVCMKLTEKKPSPKYVIRGSTKEAKPVREIMYL